MTPETAREALGLLVQETNSAQSVKSAFARCVKATHPDTQRDFYATPEAAQHLHRFKTARDVLLRHITVAESACVLCLGLGRVRAGMGWRRCAACDGTGDKS